MSAQLRFRTLVKHAGSIYDAAKEARTGLLMSSLDDIVEKINPQSATDWHKVRHDTQRVLKVWLSREQTHAAQMLADQLMDSLAEFSEAPVAVAVAVAATATPVALPCLEIEEKPTVAASAPVPIVTLLTHPVVDDEEGDDEEEDEELDDEEFDEGDEVLEDEDEDEDEDEKPAPAKVDKKPEAEAEAEAGAEDDEEVLEPEADAADAAAEDEEEGMEVEKRTIRGRDYWIDVNTNKLYAVVDDDDVGDEVGAIVNGRPVFLSA